MVVKEDTDQLVIDALRHLTAGIENETVAGLIFGVGLVVTDQLRRIFNWLPI